jgi:hypothetical protein
VPKYIVSVYYENTVIAEDEDEARELLREDAEHIMKYCIDVEEVQEDE